MKKICFIAQFPPPIHVLSPIRCKTLLDGGRRRTKNLYGVFKRTVPAGQVRQ